VLFIQTLNEVIRKKKRLNEAEAQFYLYELIMGLRYLHGQRIIHRDLKLGNLFLGQGMALKIGDFGLAAKLENDKQKKNTICGTPNYIAPEILDSNIGHSYKADVWSTGVIMYTMLIGKPPFEDTDVKATYKRIKANMYSFPEDINISVDAKRLIESILVLNPGKTATKILTVF
jgi:polo-like kinase 1